MAVATPKGLVVPVLRNVQDMNYADIEKGIADLGEKAKKNQLSVEDMDGGTFTISNGGVFGSLFGTPIINPPQSAILGMHGTFERPVVRNGQVIDALANSDIAYLHRDALYRIRTSKFHFQCSVKPIEWKSNRWWYLSPAILRSSAKP